LGLICRLRGRVVSRLGWCWRVVSWLSWRRWVVCWLLLRLVVRWFGLLISLFWRIIRLTGGRAGGVNHMNRRSIIRLIDQNREFMMGQRYIFNCRGRIGTSAISTIRV